MHNQLLYNQFKYKLMKKATYVILGTILLLIFSCKEKKNNQLKQRKQINQKL